MIWWLTYTSIFFGGVPLILSALSFRMLKFSPPMFSLLLIGFITDILNLFYKELNLDREITWNIYSIVECSILIWIVHYRRNKLTFRSFIFQGVLIALPLWVVLEYLYPMTGAEEILNIIPLSLFIILYQVYILFYAAKEVLVLGELEENLIGAPAFWIFMGIFFYAIGTFFIMSFLSKPIILYEMYYINNIVNITTHLLFSAGFVVALYSHVHRQPHSRTISSQQ